MLRLSISNIQRLAGKVKFCLDGNSQLFSMGKVAPCSLISYGLYSLRCVK